jgi:hypothetical protein
VITLLICWNVDGLSDTVRRSARSTQRGGIGATIAEMG